jgi:uncharacterized protein YecE (DUF72 family)
MEFFVGTSGWSYSWNLDGNFEWYVESSRLNAVELNMSFYRYPYANVVRSWASKGKALRWAVKANRLITHTFKFREKAFQAWGRFHSLFEPLEPCIDFYLFQLPPSMTPKFIPIIEKFALKADLGKKFAIEVRNQKWFNSECVDWASKLGITWVSVDSPDFPLDVFSTNGLVYVRMHGRTEWYSHYYSDEELREVAEKILRSEAEKAYVFFNNDHAMLENARRMAEILSK